MAELTSLLVDEGADTAEALAGATPETVVEVATKLLVHDTSAIFARRRAQLAAATPGAATSDPPPSPCLALTDCGVILENCAYEGLRSRRCLGACGGGWRDDQPEFGTAFRMPQANANGRGEKKAD